MTAPKEPFPDCLICQGKNLANNQLKLYASYFSICTKCEAAIIEQHKRKTNKKATYFQWKTRK